MQSSEDRCGVTGNSALQRVREFQVREWGVLAGKEKGEYLQARIRGSARR